MARDEFSNMLQSFTRILAKEDDVISDLWTWLPSRMAARRHHEDYAFEHEPSHVNVILEACSVLSFCSGYENEEKDHERYKCPCGTGAEDCPNCTKGQQESAHFTKAMIYAKIGQLYVAALRDVLADPHVLEDPRVEARAQDLLSHTQNLDLTELAEWAFRLRKVDVV